MVDGEKITDGATPDELPLIMLPESEDSQTQTGEKATADLQPHTKIEDQLVGMSCSCGETFLVPLMLSGNVAVCPNCHAHVRMPEDNFVRISCACGMLFKVPAILGRRKGSCPQCGRQIDIPEKSEQSDYSSPPTVHPGIADYSQLMSDDELDNVAQILLTDKFQKTPSVPATSKAHASKPHQSPGETLKNSKNLYVQVPCPCGNKLMVPLSVSHRQIKCPICQHYAKLPESNFIRMNCECGMEFKVPLILEGKSGTCPKCHKKLKITKNK